MKFIITLCILTTQFVLLGQEKTPIIVELFTSEGCSSCPPADRLLSDIVNKGHDDVEVIALSFHVDYWDYIGWKDPYAKQDFTVRQRAYGRKFGLASIYTPQMIVNGKHEFVGSNRTKWETAFDEEKRNVSNESFNVEVISISNQEIDLTIESNQTSKSLLNVAIVERKLSQDVTRGENRGRKLIHDNVVRAFHSRSFDGQKNRFTLKLPLNLKTEDASLIVYTQDENTWQVDGAKSIGLKSFLKGSLE